MPCGWVLSNSGIAKAVFGGALVALVAGCSQTPDAEIRPSAAETAPSAAIETPPSAPQQPYVPSLAHRYPAQVARLQPRIINTSRFLQCVPYARQQSNIQIRGDAWTWWRAAKGRYRRGAHPAVGSVLVLKRKGRVLKRKGRSRGHLAVVKRILDDRTIVVDHANWLNRGRIHKDIRVRDTSAGNNWSAVRVWYAPEARYGGGTYHPYGFIYPTRDGRWNARISANTPPEMMSQPSPG